MRWNWRWCVWIVALSTGVGVQARQRDGPPPLQKAALCAPTPGRIACVEQTWRRLDAQMDALYRMELQKVMGTYAERRLLHAQNLWRRWANAECLFRNGPADRGGLQWPIRQDACLTGMIRGRIAELDGFLRCSGATCPPR